MLTFSITTGMRFSEEGAFQKAYASSFALRFALLIGTIAVTLAMGFVAEWMAPKTGFVNALVCGVIMTVVNLLYVTMSPGASMQFMSVVGIVGVIPVALVGGWLAGVVEGA